MYGFFVLGLVPGTDIQITFDMWLQAATVLCGAIAVLILIRRFIQERRLNAIPQETIPQLPIDTSQLYPSA
jgi:membrane protein implicated in regulation of membrane protease activity